MRCIRLTNRVVKIIGCCSRRGRIGLAVSLVLLVGLVLMFACGPRGESTGRQVTPLTDRILRQTLGDPPSEPPCEGFVPERRGNFIRWTRDGSSIVFYSNKELYRVAADGSAVRWINTVPEGALGWNAFDVAPDGEQIVYATCATRSMWPDLESEDSGFQPHHSTFDYSLVRARIDGTAPKRLPTPQRVGLWTVDYGNFPSWAPNGARIALISGLSYVVVRSLDGSEPQRNVFGGVTLESASPQWSPDSQRLAFTGTPPGRYSVPTVYTVTADGSDPQALVVDVVSAPTWSPDGRWLAYARVQRGKVILAIIRADGSDERVVARAEGWESGVRADASGSHDPRQAWIRTLAWSPDGAHLLYTCGRKLCVVTTDGRPVARTPVELFGGNMGTWSPDGTRIAVAGLGLGHEVLYTMTPDDGQVCSLVVARYDADSRNPVERLWRLVFGLEAEYPLVAVRDCEAAA